MIKPKKKFGQHFLTDHNIAKKIVNLLSYHPNMILIEIGAGTGIFTNFIQKKTYHRFIALDIDKESVSFLEEKYSGKNIEILNADFLQYSLNFKNPISIIGNFPYNISSQIFFKVWEHRHIVNQVVCIIQKEVALRICSREGSRTYGILSVLLQAFYEIEFVFSVPPNVFNPSPKVNSGVILLKRNVTKQLPCDEKLFKTIVKLGFGQRRKTLRNALKSLNLRKNINELAILDRRAEQLNVEDFIFLTSKIS